MILFNTTLFSPQDNAEKEWAYQKAITIQTYCDYHPIPVPINIISLLCMSFYCFKKDKDINWKEVEVSPLLEIFPSVLLRIQKVKLVYRRSGRLDN